MTEELTKRENPQLDGFDAYDDSIEGESEQGQGRGVIQGACIKFTNEAAWVTRDGAELSPNLELMVVDIGRIVQKWATGRDDHSWPGAKISRSQKTQR